ncbi:MAG: transposase [Ignavibacteriae bacterium]|nr:transposase [Ignavibacteriota bacterium]
MTFTYIESFNGKLREECLNENWFTSLEEAKRIIEEWREDYNCYRPHTSLKGLSPWEFINKEENLTKKNVLQDSKSFY